MNIAVTGGAGYVGSALVPQLLLKGHSVTVLDTFWFGDHLPNHPKLTKIKGDIRNVNDLNKVFSEKDAVIHLACVSNDPSFDMNPHLGEEINLKSFPKILTAIKRAGVERFIYASSSSVYGVSELKDVTEDAKKSPLTNYSKHKLTCESMLSGMGTGGMWTIVRPATVCGYAPRLRLDLVVNILTIHALVNKKIILFGREQKRPNINVQDMALAYDFILNAKEALIDQQTFNVGFENLSLYQIANLVKMTIGDPKIDIVEEPTNDPRSYHINSDKISSLGFWPTYSIKDAISSIEMAYRAGLLKDPINNPEYCNIKKMKGLGL